MYHKKATLSVFFLVILITCVFFCFSGFAQDNAPAVAYQRIVSLKPNITRIFQSLGLSDRLVGITKFCDPSFTQAEVVADYNSINIEALIRLKPDLIVGSTENSRQKEYQLIKDAGLTVVLLNFDSYEALKQSLVQLGTLLNIPDQAAQVILTMDQKIQKLYQRFVQTPANEYVAIIQRRPLMIASGNTYLSSLLSQIGLRNVFQNNTVAYPVIDEEELIRETVAFTFDLSHDAKTEESTFLNKNVIPLSIEDFLASPQSVDNLEKVVSLL